MLMSGVPRRYTSFQTSGLHTSGAVSKRGTVTVSFTVANTGDRAGTEVVPVYVHQPVSDVVAPDRRQLGFAVVTLDPGQSQSVQVSFPAGKLAVTPADINGDGRPAVEPGAYQAVVGNLTAGFTLR
jgi:beta-glucosidase